MAQSMVCPSVSLIIWLYTSSCWCRKNWAIYVIYDAWTGDKSFPVSMVSVVGTSNINRSIPDMNLHTCFFSIEWMNEWMDEWMNEIWMKKWINRMNEWINEWMNKWINEWINGMNEWMVYSTTSSDNIIQNVQYGKYILYSIIFM